ncbi:hypothetical protein DM02DRAFT_545827 [Periconia macrospinosa]|uniref:Uncharacterized protein n=1 Tax=Periconia macrospinosa TaxID=97972 RepID=A0A2V1D2D3_9PLEO|nr:hypothetical protein DM02DRAFT_545827 [Periconia macrospinosa]
MFYNVLPAFIQNRISTLPSIRRSISHLHGRALRTKSASTVTEISPPVTPPPSYTARPGSARSSRSSVVSITDGETTFRDDVSERPKSSMSTPLPFSTSETQTGVIWKYANQGISLVTQAYQESHALARKADETSTLLTRQLYIHSITYLLRGLPAELTPEEILSLQAAVPQSIVIQNDTSANDIVLFTQDAPVSQGPPPDASIVHRVTAIVVFETFVVIQFFLPYIKLFVGHAYRFERQHKVTQRLVYNGIMTADALRRRSLQLSHTICQMNNGKVGQAINDLSLWWVKGLTGGVEQGIQDGVTMFSNERPASSKGRVEKLE